ncbi:hypothetical protein [Chryseobacterium sp. RU37D]|nr:hypothetical protein [Chryseobacterium sp. RU37D]
MKRAQTGRSIGARVAGLVASGASATIGGSPFPSIETGFSPLGKDWSIWL